MSNSNLRYSGAIWSDIVSNILVVGIGGTGRGIAEMLSLYGHNVTVVDDDVVEQHNCIPQGYGQHTIGVDKVQALNIEILDKYPYETVNLSLTKSTIQSSLINVRNFDIVISCVDNFDTRKYIVERFQQFNPLCGFIDTRLLAEYFEIIQYPTFHDVDDEYMESINAVDSDEYVACTYRQTRHIAIILHGLVINMINMMITNKDKKTQIFKVPKKIKFSAALNKFDYDYVS
jgi:hypothetical protein